MQCKLHLKKKIAFLAISSGLVFLALGCQGTKEELTLKETVLAYETEVHEVGQEEYEFYKELYRSENKEEIDEKALEEWISHKYAEFYLGKYLGVRENDTYEGLREEWERENASRQEKKNNGEVVYGVVTYDFSEYYEYVSSNLRIQNIDAMADMADTQLVEAAKAYYEENLEEYEILQDITCILSDGEREETKVFSYDEILSLQKTKEEAYLFLMDAQEGDTFQYENGDKTVTMEFVSKNAEIKDFEDIKGVVMNDYIEREYYENLIDEIIEKGISSFEKG